MSDHHRSLVLLRHAKSSYPAGVADHDRPLAPRGAREAGLAGEWLHANLPAVDEVLCSTATRARETFAHAGVDAPVRYIERLYDATTGTAIAEINTVADDIDTLLVIGHEPAMAQVAIGLAGTNRTSATVYEHISAKFPTSAIAVLRVGCRWKHLGLGGAALVGFHVPR